MWTTNSVNSIDGLKRQKMTYILNQRGEMKMKKKVITLLSAVLMVCWLAVFAQAALIDRDGGLIYDTYLDITWLQDANYAQTSGYDSDGKMTWDTAMTWAADLAYHDSVRDVIWDDWRLPTVLDPGPGHMSPSELWDMFHFTLIGNPGDKISENHNANYYLFTNIQDDGYWSDTEVSLWPSWAYYTNFDGGVNGGDEMACAKDNEFYAWAVRPGDVGVVPVPGTLFLLCSGLSGLVSVKKWLGRIPS